MAKELILRQTELNMPLIKHLEEIKHPDFDADDRKTLQAKITGKKYSEYSEVELKQIVSGFIARIGLLTGVYVPTGNVFEFLRVELTEFILQDEKFSSLTFEENIQAFRLFVKGLIGGDKKDYGKLFNVEYYAKITMAYVRYRSEVFFKLDQYQTKLLMDKSESEHPGELTFYETTEMAYQQYLSGKYNLMVWNPNCYDTCVKMKWASADLYTDFIDKAKAKLIVMKGDEIKEFEKTHIKLDGNIYSSKDNLPNNIGKLMNAVFDLTKIKNGEQGWLIICVAKQLALEKIFKEFALSGYYHLFVKTDDK